MSRRELLDPHAAADRIGSNEPTLRSWRYRRQGPPWIKVGKLIRYDAAALEAWLQSQTVTPDDAA